MTSVPSQSSEELSNSEIPSAIGPCIQDDKEFIRNARARTTADDVERLIKGGKRVALLWEALWELPDGLRKRVFQWVTCWLFMRSQLFPTQQDSIIYLGSEYLYFAPLPVFKYCTPCLAHKSVRGPESPPSWTPSYALVALRWMWDSTAKSRDFSKWLRHCPINGFKEANEFLSSLPRDTDEDQYLSWVNKYPSDLRGSITRYGLKEWQAMDDCIQTSERSRSLNIRSWCAAMFWRMIPPGLSHSARVKQFIDAWRYSVLRKLEFLPRPMPAPEFRDAIRDSGHTCWEEWDMDDYAAAMAFLEEDPKVVGVDVRKYSKCQVCQLKWCLWSLSENLPVEEPDLTELLVMLRTECSRRKVAWDDVLTSVQKKSVAGSDSLDSSEESDDGDGGSDDDEASWEDERAPGALIHPSQVNTAGHGENNPSSGVNYDNEAVDVDEESADMTGPLIFTNPPSENPHPYSIGPGNFDRQESHDSQQINALPTIYSGFGSDHSFGHITDVSLHPPALDSIQNWPPNSSTNQGGTLAPWNQGPSEGGSDLTVGRQQGYIGTSASNFVEKASVGRNGGLGDYATTEPSVATYPTANPVQSQIPSAIDIGQNLFPSRNTPRINSQSHASSAAAAVGLALPSKRQMADEIKKHLTDEMVRVGISLPQTGQGQVKLPWLDL